MSAEGPDKQLDYHGLILGHLSRLSFVCTSNFIETMNPSLESKYQNPPNSGEIALSWGVTFLYSMVPDDLRDESFEKERDGIKGSGCMSDFQRLKVMINLLHRKGLLIQDKQLGGFSKKPKAKEDLPIREEFEE